MLALPFRAASALLAAGLDCFGFAPNRRGAESGWQTLTFNIELDFTLQGIFALQSGNLNLCQPIDL